MHLGNARTALFNALLAVQQQGIFLLRIEDTDQERSREEFQHALQEDLWWLGLHWQEGPVVSGEHEPYQQAARSHIYGSYYDRLSAAGAAYPCFCSAQELEISRKAQAARGQAPRYTGKCRNLSPAEVETRLQQGLAPTLRFRVPKGESIQFTDGVRGEQRFMSDDIGDFILRRGDGSPAFFFSNAIDDALMGVTHVLRGEDHLANTPRQMLILQALGLPVPEYSHIALIVGADGSPLSKRHGSRSIRELRENGYLPLALLNYMARLGHSYDQDQLLNPIELATNFNLQRLGRAPAHYDAHQLLHWQHQSIAALDSEVLWEWMGASVHALVPAAHKQAFMETIRPNISFPEHALKWANAIFHDPLLLNDASREIVAEAGNHFFEQAVVALAEAADFNSFSSAVKQRTDRKGKQLFMPLRTALTGEQGGPEMARLFELMTPERMRSRLQACIQH